MEIDNNMVKELWFLSSLPLSQTRAAVVLKFMSNSDTYRMFVAGFKKAASSALNQLHHFYYYCNYAASTHVVAARRCISASTISGRGYLMQASAITNASGSGNSVEITVDSGVATMKMQKPPVNSLSLEHLTDICIALDKLHAEGTRGLILGSSVPKIFSAGLEITEMYQPDVARLKEFWRTLQDVWIKLYGSPMMTVAAITGHAPAGGALLSMCCDHRVMADGKFTIGLNETLLGIVAPPWFSDTMINTVGHRESERALQLGKLYSPQEALNVGLVDEVVPLDDVYTSVSNAMKQSLKIPDHARHLTKLQLRQPTLDRLLTRREDDIDHFVNFITKESIQKSLGMYLEALKNKAK